MNGFLLTQIRKSGPFTTDDLWREIQLFRRIQKIEGLPETLTALTSMLETAEIDKLIVEGPEGWKAVPQVARPQQESQRILF